MFFQNNLFDDNSVEGKIYGSLCLLSAIVCLLKGVTNFFFDISFGFNILLIVLSPIYFWLYLDFKKKKLTQVKFLVFITSLFFILTLGWFTGNGILGSTTIIYFLFVSTMLLIMSTKFYKFLIPLLMMFFVLLFVSQQYFFVVIRPYQSKAAQEWDVFSASLIALSLLIYLIYVFKDVYEKEQSELRVSVDVQAKALLEAEKLALMQSDFLANMSHEIRTPLNGIIGNADLLLNIADSEDPKEYAESISNSSEVLLGLLNNILDLSKIESNKLRLIKSPFKLSELLLQVEGIFKHTAYQKGVGLFFNVEGKVKNSLVGDGNRVKQILINIIGNAIKFTDNGHVTVTVSSVEDVNFVDLRFKIEDTGIGIPEEYQDKVFTRFFQIDQSSNRIYQGSGLGLVITKNFVELMGGTIYLKSQKNKGSTFLFNLNLEKEQATTKDKKNKILKEMIYPKIKILVAEDNEINQTLMQKQLEKFGYQVTLATNGVQVLKCFETGEFDLVFMDVQMPEMDGVEATVKLRALNLKKQPIIVAITANALKEDKDKCLEAGMNDYLSRPLTIQELGNVILNWF